MKKQLCAIFLCLILLTLPACAARSRYGPSLVERAVERSASMSVTKPDGTVVKPELLITDIDVVGRANEVEAKWEKLDRRAHGFDMTSALSQAGIGILPAIIGFFFDLTPFGAAISGIGALIGKFVEVINPSARMEAYSDGIKMLVDARNEYMETEKGKIPNDKLTDAARVLAKKTDYAIRVVENAISGRVSSIAELSGATVK